MPRRWLIGLGLLLLFALQAAFRFPSSLIHDTAWYVVVAEGLLDGKKLYVDYVEVNPPLGMWLVVPPVWLARAVGASPVALLYGWLLLLTAGATGLAWRNGQSLASARPCQWILAVAAILLFVPGNNFGQREHFMVLLFLPWVLLRADEGAKPPLWERAAIGLCAGLAIALKPHAIFAPLLVEAVRLWQQRGLRRLIDVENLAAVAGVIAYAACIAAFTPGFFSGIIALGRTAYLPYYGYPLPIILMDAKWAVIFMALALFGIRHRAVQMFWAASLGFLISYALQMKGFTYQILPATSFALFACAAGLALGLAPPRSQRLAGAVTALAAAALLVAEPQAYAPNRDISARIEALRGPEVKSVFIASNRFSHAFPYVLEQHLAWASRLPTQWLVPYVSDHWKPGEAAHDPIVAQALDWTMDDLATLKPDLVAIDNSEAQRAAMGGFEFLKFWAEDPRFAPLWANYRQVASEGGILIYLRQK